MQKTTASKALSLFLTLLLSLGTFMAAAIGVAATVNLASPIAYATATAATTIQATVGIDDLEGFLSVSESNGTYTISVSQQTPSDSSFARIFDQSYGPYFRVGFDIRSEFSAYSCPYVQLGDDSTHRYRLADFPDQTVSSGSSNLSVFSLGSYVLYIVDLQTGLTQYDPNWPYIGIYVRDMLKDLVGNPNATDAELKAAYGTKYRFSLGSSTTYSNGLYYGGFANEFDADPTVKTQDISFVFVGEDDPVSTHTVSFNSNGGSAVSSIADIANNSTITAPNAPTKSGYTFAGWYKDSALQNAWNFSTDSVTANITLYAKWTANGSGGGSGSSGNSSGSGSGSSGGSSGSGSPSTQTPTTSANVNTNGSINSTTISQDLGSALKSAEGTKANVKVVNAQSISASTIKSLANQAQKAGKQATIFADTVGADGKIQGRMYIEPAALSGITSDIKLGVATTGINVEIRKQQFEKYFDNNISVISLAHEGEFGATLKIAAKVELKDTSKLVVYSYNSETGKYTKLNTTCFVDSGGFVHFSTPVGGDIIISNGELTPKK